jgi:hypothetical protein
MGPRQVEQGALFYNFSLDAHVPGDHLLRCKDRMFASAIEVARPTLHGRGLLGGPSRSSAQ